MHNFFRARVGVFLIFATILPAGCGKSSSSAPPQELVVYCGVDEPYATPCFTEFEKQTGIHITVEYDVESNRSVGMSGKLEAEKDNPHADVWWSNEPFLSVRLADEGILDPYHPSTAADVPAQFKDADGYWTGVGLRARVLAVADPPPPFPITGLQDLLDPRLKDKICIGMPTAGATGAHVAVLYAVWGPEKAAAFFQKLHDNGAHLLGGNSDVANYVGQGVYSVGLTDNDDIADANANGAKITMVLPDQNGEGTVANSTTVGLVHGAHNPDAAKKLIDFLVSQENERRLIDLKFARWSVRGPDAGGEPIKCIPIDYRAVAAIYPRAQREATAILQGRNP